MNRLYNRVNQQTFIDSLHTKLQLKCFDDWVLVKRSTIVKEGGKSLLTFYSNNLHSLFLNIYPYYPWELHEFQKPKSFSLRFQQTMMEKLFKEFNFTTLEDWKGMTRKRFCAAGGQRVFNLYSHSFPRLLTSIYPNYAWHFAPKLKLTDRTVQSSLIEVLFEHMGLDTLQQWGQVKVRELVAAAQVHFQLPFNPIQSILFKHYGKNKQTMLSSLYPNYPWASPSMVEQWRMMEQLMELNHFTTLDQLRSLTAPCFDQLGYTSLLQLYRSPSQLLASLYPFFPWVDPMYDQLQQMQKIFQKLKLKEVEEWTKVTCYQMIRAGGRQLLQHYHYDFGLLLRSLYPHIDWLSLPPLRFLANPLYKLHNRLSINSTNIKQRKKLIGGYDYSLVQLLQLQQRYMVRCQQDWYRLGLRMELPLYRALVLLHPEQSWNKQQFLLKGKKSVQRLLYASVYSLFPTHPLLENYHHPHLHSSSHLPHPLEYDLFLPSLQLAVEYQGEYHYDDINIGYSSSILYQTRDQLKLQLSQLLHIQLITVPFWWDHSLPSLLPSPPSLFPHHPSHG